MFTDSGKADVLYNVWEETIHTEGLAPLEAMAEENHSNFCMDRDSSNIKADRFYDQNHDDVHHRSCCYSHCMMTVTGYVLGNAPGLASAVIALDMATRHRQHQSGLFCCDHLLQTCHSEHPIRIESNPTD